MRFTRLAWRWFARAFLLVSMLSLVFGLSVAMAGTQEDDMLDPNPLRTADTSSPRATLQSFRNDLGDVIDDQRLGQFSVKTGRAFLRAINTLDFSTTPNGDAWLERTRRVLLLAELLGRIELPPEEAIPGEQAVADGAVAEWTIPNTAITIASVEAGPRKGEFLFSADTVQRLHRFYESVKDLPPRPGAVVGLYEQWLGANTGPLAPEQEVRNRLQPVDTASPRSTMEGFLDSVNRAYALVTETEAALRATPPTLTKQQAREIEVTASNFLQRAVRTLDLNEVPDALRDNVGVESVLQLKEIFDRIQLPPVDTVPDPAMVAVAREQGSGAIRWRYPNTGVEIVEVTEGERQGEFLFSAATVRRVGQFYQQIESLPYREGVRSTQWISPGKSEGFFDHFISSPGYLIPQAHPFGKAMDALPPWLKTLHGQQTRWQWIGLVASVLALAALAYVVFRVLKRTGQRIGAPFDGWLMFLAPVIIALLASVIADFIDNDLNISGDLSNAILAAGRLIVTVMGAWAFYLLSSALAETIIARPQWQQRRSEAALLRISAMAIGLMGAVWVVIAGVRALGAELIPILAGLGVGGLAVALAAQTTIANFIGGLILFIDKPVRVGDFCRYGEDPAPGWWRIGTIEQIGWMSTRVRGIDRTLTTIPNAEFSKMHIVNLTERDQRLFRTTLQLRYETTPEQMRFVLTRLRELLLGHPMVTATPARVRYISLGAYSKDVDVYCYFACREENDFLAIQEDLLLRIEDIVNEAGTGFAFPSQTAYLARDAGLDAERGEAAERDMQRRRATGKLPFPEFEEEERDRLENILDYPPKGSPDYTPRGA
ncbi:MAG: mechanosensitive ion channel family protein [Sedimenticolaceae bacterium]